MATTADQSSVLRANVPRTLPSSSDSGSSSQTITIPGGFGAAIIMMFTEMMKYLREMADQGFELMKDQATALVGTNGDNGMINSWLQAGFNAAIETGNQLKDQATQSLVTAIASGVGGGLMLAGAAWNTTGMFGKFFGLNERGQVAEDLECAQTYQKTVANPSGAKDPVFNFGDEEGAIPLKDMRPSEQIRTDENIQQRLAEMRKGVNIDKFSEKSANYEDTLTAAKHMTPEERTDVLEKADKKVETTQSRLDQFHQRQNTFVNYVNIAKEAANAGGNYYYGMQAASDATDAGSDKARADVVQTAVSTTSDSEGKASTNAQSNRDQMAQMAQALASALNAQVKQG